MPCRHHLVLVERRPGQGGNARGVVDVWPLCLENSQQCAAIGGEAGLGPVVPASGDLARLAATHFDDEQLRIRESKSGFIAIGGRAEHHCLIVRREFDFDFFARVGLAAGKPGAGREPGARQQIARIARSETVLVERLHEDTCLAFVEPAVPAADREAVEDACIRLARVMRLDELLVSGVVLRLRIHERHESQLTTVMRIDRGTCAAGEIGQTLSFAARRQIERVDLRHVVVVALRAEGDALAVRAPRHAVFRPARRGQPTARMARGSVDEPQVAELRVVVVGGFDHRRHEPAAIGADLRRAHAFHEPDVFVRRGCAWTPRRQPAELPGRQTTTRWAFSWPTR